MTLSEIRRILDGQGLQLTKSLGQNFLHDQNILRKIAALGELRAGDNLLEIGPGLGPLTELLLASGAEVFAIEKDKRLCTFLSGKFANQPRFKLLCADALRYLKETPRAWSGWKLISNLPYSVASPILVELAFLEHYPERLVATLQLEVAQRIAARAGDEAYGQLSLFLQVRYRPAEMFKVPAGCFFPAPDVDSACLALHRRETPLLDHQQLKAFQQLVKRSFAERRKMMFKLLKGHWPETLLRDAFETAKIPPQARAEAVSLEQFVVLANRLSSSVQPLASDGNTFSLEL